jgi:hypothetical protein
MVSTATYQNISSKDIYGKRTGGTVVSFKCHVKYNRREVYTPEGNMVVLGGSVIMDDVYDIQKGAILSLPNGDTPKIVSVQTFFDEVGPHHTTVDFEG